MLHCKHYTVPITPKWTWQGALSFCCMEQKHKSNTLQKWLIFISLNHRRRLNTEEKAKVVAAVWGTNVFSSLPCQLFCTIGRLRIDSWYLSKQKYQVAKKVDWKKEPTRQTWNISPMSVPICTQCTQWHLFSFNSVWGVDTFFLTTIFNNLIKTIYPLCNFFFSDLTTANST